MPTSPTRAYLILHGWQNHRPTPHWQHHLTTDLRALGHEVHYPQLPDPDTPDLDTWLAELTRHLGELKADDRTVICHSLACVLWLHALHRDLVTVQPDRVLLVAPPAPEILARYPEVSAFAPPPLAPERLHRTRLVASAGDPYCPGGAAKVYGEPLRIRTDVLPASEAHLDLPAGYGSWPSMLEWCLDPAEEHTFVPR